MLSWIPFALVFLAAVSANPAYLDLVVHEKRDFAPIGFVAGDSVPSETNLALRFALVQGDPTGLEKALYDVSSPGSDRYGKHLSKDEVAAFVRPSDRSNFLVKEWLTSHNLHATSVSLTGDWLDVSIPVTKANELLNANFNVFKHRESGQQTIRTLSYAIPTVLKDHISLVHPTVNFPTLFKHSTHSLRKFNGARNNNDDILPDLCQTITTPKCLQNRYGIPATSGTQSSNSLFVSSFSGQSANTADLQTFMQAYRPDLPSSSNFALQSVDNGQNSQDISEASQEGNLDIQYTIGLASTIPVTFLSVGPSEWASKNDFATSLLDEANYLLSLDHPPYVLTTSYGFDEVNITQPMAETICNAYMQLGARGISVIYASGDGGIGGSHSTNCDNKPFIATFPASCPYVTSVGATKISDGTTEESAATFSSGGFSNFFPAPAYQSAAIPPYIKGLGKKYKGLYNVTGRGIPDVALLGVKYAIQWKGQGALSGGTSASSPTFASIISLLNDQLISAGKSPLGFLNPLLYSENGVAAFKDITSGSNPGCNTQGFSASKGWDPVTGLGTPVFDRLLSAVGL